MNEPRKHYDLEERTERFANNVADFTELLPKVIRNIEYSKQVIRSSGSAASNYIEANDSFSRKEFIYRVKICRKEAKETGLWLRLMKCPPELHEKRNALNQEATELMKIFGSIIRNSE